MKKVFLLLLLCVSCSTLKNNPNFYNVVYRQGDNVIEYHDVHSLYHYNDYVYFELDDGTIVHLSSGAIEIIPIDVD